jgi:DNA-binding NtrC family response regulator
MDDGWATRGMGPERVGRARSGTVLLVDDDPNVLNALRRALRGEPYRVLTADGPSAAFALLGQEHVDLVVSDHEMPGMPGTAFLGRVQAAYPDTLRFMLTGRGSLEVAIRATNEGGVSRFFTKPCNPVELSIGIREGLKQQQLLRESRRLLRTVRQQSALLDGLAGGRRSADTVERDESGAIVVEELPTDLDGLLKELQSAVEAADARLRDGRR